MSAEPPAHDYDLRDAQVLQDVHGEVGVATLPVCLFWVRGVGRGAVAGQAKGYDAVFCVYRRRVEDGAEGL